jgi:hypothetical protein
VAEDVFGRWDGGGFREMVNEGAEEFGFGGPFLDRFGEIGVHVLCRGHGDE